MKYLNFEELGVKKLKKQQANKISGGSFWSKLGGWITVAANEVVDVITSDGENLREAYENGQEAGEAFTS